MRPDVKLGIVISAVVVLVAGTYYLYRDKGETPIELASGPESLPDPVAAVEGAQGMREDPERAEPLGSGQDVTEPGGRMADRGSTPARTQAGKPTGDSKARQTVTSTNVPGTTGKEEPGTRPARRRETSARQSQLADGTPDRTGKDEGATGDRPASSGAVARLDRAAQRRSAGQAPSSATRSRRPVPLASAKQQAGDDTVHRRTIEQEAAVETHRVQPGDTFSSLSERYYGSAKFTGFLIESNPHISDPNRLRIGTVVKIPPRPSGKTLQQPTAAGESAVTLAGGERRTYRVQPGDSFYAIARDVLGDPGRWKELFDLNKELVHGDPTRLQVDQVVVLPNP